MRTFKRIVIVLFTVILITAAMLFIRMPFNKGNDLITKVNSWEQVKAYQYEKTPGLERAEKLKLTREFDTAIEFPESTDMLAIHEIWYNLEHIYVFYSVDMKLSAASLPREADIPYVSFRVKADQESTFENPIFAQNWAPTEGVYYKGRIYGRATTNSIRNDVGELEKVERLKLTGVNIRKGDTTVALPDVLLTANFDAAEEKLESIAIKHSHYALGESIELNRLDLGTTINRLYFEYSSSNQSNKFVGAEVVIQTNEGEMRQGIIYSEDSLLYVAFQPFNRRPKSIELEWQTLKFFNKENQIEFKIDATKYKDHVREREDSHREEVNRKIGSLQNTNIFLQEIYYDDRGISFQVEYKKDKGLKIPYLHLYPEMPNSIFPGASQEEKTKQKNILPMLVHVVNERGEEAEIGQRGSGSGGRYSAFIDAAITERSKELNVTVSNLITELVVDWKSSIPVPLGE